MVPVLAKMSIIIKSRQKTAVIMGNYEMAYACGLLYNVCGKTPPEIMSSSWMRIFRMILKFWMNLWRNIIRAVRSYTE